MKNTTKKLGIIIFTAIIGLSIIACLSVEPTPAAAAPVVVPAAEFAAATETAANPASKKVFVVVDNMRTERINLNITCNQKTISRAKKERLVVNLGEKWEWYIWYLDGNWRAEGNASLAINAVHPDASYADYFPELTLGMHTVVVIVTTEDGEAFSDEVTFELVK